jgi:hypothetical protein
VPGSVEAQYLSKKMGNKPTSTLVTKPWFAHAVSAQAHCAARLGVTL